MFYAQSTSAVIEEEEEEKEQQQQDQEEEEDGRGGTVFRGCLCSFIGRLRRPEFPQGMNEAFKRRTRLGPGGVPINKDAHARRDCLA